MGTLSGCGSLDRELLQQATTFAASFTHADDSAAAHRDSGSSDARESFQPILVGSRGNDVAVKLGGRVEVVVVGGESRVCQQVGLFLSQHAERAAGFHSERANSADHFQDLTESGIFGNVTPCRTHAESGRSLRLRTCGRRERFTDIEQALASSPVS